MGTTADKINYLNDTKAAIKEAIENKGVTVSDSDTFRSYAEKIGDIEGGSVFTIKNQPISAENDANNSNEHRIKNIITKIDLSDISFDVEGWGSGENTLNASYMFEDFMNLTSVKFPSNCQIYSFNNAFSGCKSLQSIDLSSLDLSILHGTAYMFQGCTSLMSVTFPYTQVQSSVGSYSAGMFSSCSSLTTVDLSQVTFQTDDFSNMFAFCSSLQSLSLNPMGWASNVSNLSMTFEECTSLETINVNGWSDVMFSNESLMEVDLSWCPLSSTTMYDMSSNGGLAIAFAYRSNSPTLKISGTTNGYIDDSIRSMFTNKGWTIAETWH